MMYALSRSLCAASVALGMLACGGSTASIGGADSGEADAGPSMDGGSLSDSSGADSGRPDASDSSAPDSNVPDVRDASPADGGRVPIYHRPDDSQCSQPAPPGNCTFASGACTHDGQCTSGTNGRCVESNGGVIYCSCTYDTCVHDTDCAVGQLCVCHGSAYTNAGNTCMPGNCRVDSDCGAGGYCSPSHGTVSCGGVSGYYCHGASDQCTDDSDCSGMGGLDVCAWSSTGHRWECQMELLCQ
jgi:hypothetical protein